MRYDNRFFENEFGESIVNTIDIAKKYLSLLNEKDYDHKIPHSILSLILNNSEQFSYSTLQKIEKNLTYQLSEMEKDKRLLLAKIDFEENVVVRKKLQDELNVLDIDIMETYDNIAYLAPQMDDDIHAF